MLMIIIFHFDNHKDLNFDVKSKYKK